MHKILCLYNGSTRCCQTGRLGFSYGFARSYKQFISNRFICLLNHYTFKSLYLQPFRKRRVFEVFLTISIIVHIISTIFHSAIFFVFRSYPLFFILINPKRTRLSQASPPAGSPFNFKSPIIQRVNTRSPNIGPWVSRCTERTKERIPPRETFGGLPEKARGDLAGHSNPDWPKAWIFTNYI